MVAVVTGASRGLGAVLAASFLARGMSVATCARTRPDAPDAASVNSTMTDDDRWMASSVDVTDAVGLDQFAASVVERFGRIDVWVSNAGVIAPIGPLVAADPEALRAHVATNVLGVMHGAAAFARHVRRRPGGGVLVTVSSGAATSAYEGWGPYCASKAAAEMLTEVVGLEEAEHGLIAYSVSPGVLDTEMQAEIRTTSIEAFPSVDRFHRIHAEGTWTDMEWVAECIVARCIDPATRDLPVAGSGSVRFRVPDRPEPT